jgi:hypothetical protein
MPRRLDKKVQAAKDTDSDPKAPVDLWQQLDKVYQENDVRIVTTIQPPDTFTAKQLSAQRGCGYTAAKSQIQQLLALGKIEFVSYGPNNVRFYRLKK